VRSYGVLAERVVGNATTVGRPRDSRRAGMGCGKARHGDIVDLGVRDCALVERHGTGIASIEIDKACEG